MLDRFTRVHPAVPALLYLPVVAVLVGYATERHERGHAARAGPSSATALWTLTEYWLHRIVFHFEPEDGLGAKLHWLIHGVHHEHPNDPNRLVMPPSASIPLAAIFLVRLPRASSARRRGWRCRPASWSATSSTTRCTGTCTTASRAAGWGGACASCTCATTSRTTPAASGSARPTGIASSAPRRSPAARRGRREEG